MPASRFHAVFVAALLAAGPAVAAPAADLVREALVAEARLETRRALELFLAAEEKQPEDPFILQKIARQFSDLVVELPPEADKRSSVERALDYSRRAVALAPTSAENVLSVAICLGKLGLYSSTRDKVRYSRLMRLEAERALALDPNYAWAHHILGRWHHEVAELGTTARLFVKLFYGGLPDASAAAAVHHLERAVALEPGQLKHHLELGFALVAAGQPDRARAAFATGLALPSREKHDEAAKARARDALRRLGGAPDSPSALPR
jgi:tetratricopeptide (TPR) repeat protein